MTGLEEESGDFHTFSLDIPRVSEIEKIDVVRSLLTSFQSMQLNRFNVRTFFESGSLELKNLLTIVSFSDMSILLSLKSAEQSWGYRSGRNLVSCFFAIVDPNVQDIEYKLATVKLQLHHQIRMVYIGRRDA